MDSLCTFWDIREVSSLVLCSVGCGLARVLMCEAQQRQDTHAQLVSKEDGVSQQQTSGEPPRESACAHNGIQPAYRQPTLIDEYERLTA